MFRKGQDICITPHKFSLLIIIKYYLKNNDAFQKQQLGHFLIEQLTVISDFTEKSFEELKSVLGSLTHGVEARDHLSEKYEKLMGGPGGVDMIYSFFSKIKALIPNDEEETKDDDDTITIQGISKHSFKNSPLMLFVRRMVLSYNQLMFSGLCRLWDELEHYYCTDHHGVLSPQESEKFANREAEVIERSFGTMPRAQIEERIEKLKYFAPNLPKAHFLSYMNYIYHGEFEKAVDDLHRYFDYAILSITQLPDGSIVPEDSIKKPFMLFPYATLNLAGLHFRFGHMNEGINLIHETIRVAQERNDDQCLALALSWLCRLISAKPGNHSQEFQILNRCVARSSELQLLFFSGQSTLALANHYLLHPPQIQGEPNYDRGEIHELLRKSAIDAREDYKQDFSGLDKLMSASYILKMHCWSLYGNKDKTRLCAQLQMENYTKLSDVNDSCLAMCRLAYEYAELGDFDLSVKLLKEAKTYFSLPPTQHSWHQIAYQILHMWALRRSQLSVATYLGTQLNAISATHVTDIHACIDSKYRHIKLLMKKELFSEAIKQIDLLTEICIKNGLQIYLGSLQLLQAEIHLEIEAYSSALPFCLSSITTCKQYHLKTLGANAKVVLFEIQFEMNVSPEEILKNLEPLKSVIFTRSDNEVVIRVHLLISKIALFSENFDQALESLQSALNIATKIEDIDNIILIYYFLIRVYDQQGKNKERDEAFQEFKFYETKKAEAIQYQADNMYFLNIFD